MGRSKVALWGFCWICSLNSRLLGHYDWNLSTWMQNLGISKPILYQPRSLKPSTTESHATSQGHSLVHNSLAGKQVLNLESQDSEHCVCIQQLEGHHDNRQKSKLELTSLVDVPNMHLKDCTGHTWCPQTKLNASIQLKKTKVAKHSRDKFTTFIS